jgi:hypothetical protein
MVPAVLPTLRVLLRLLHRPAPRLLHVHILLLLHLHPRQDGLRTYSQPHAHVLNPLRRTPRALVPHAQSDTKSVHLFKYSVDFPGEMKFQVDGGTVSNQPSYGTSDSSREFGSKYVHARRTHLSDSCPTDPVSFVIPCAARVCVGVRRTGRESAGVPPFKIFCRKESRKMCWHALRSCFFQEPTIC